jgi:hypothetical protein
MFAIYLGGWRKFESEEFHDFYSTPRRMRWERPVACMGEENRFLQWKS